MDETRTVNKPKVGEIQMTLEKLHGIVEDARTRLENLEARISPILRGDYPEKDIVKDRVEFQSAVAREIDSAQNSIEFICKRMENIISRVEL